jgi:trehalose synthase
VSGLLDAYAEAAGPDVISHLRQLAQPMRGMKVVHVNSTRTGGGVAEILDKLVPLSCDLGLDTRWEVITGDAEFFQCTKGMHNALQGSAAGIREGLLRIYEATNAANAERLRDVLEDADVVFIHDPQPASLIEHCPRRRGKWVWRCHIDASHPYRPVWKYLRRTISQYDAAVFSLPSFAQALPQPEYIIPPSIDPLSEKNLALGSDEIEAVCRRFELDSERPLVAQISRFDRFKDPVGVISAYRMAKRYVPGLQLVLAGGSASDDPEGEIVLAEVRSAAEGDPDCHVLLLPPDAPRTINALQRAADMVLQKSTKEGFGLTVTEAMWKAKPVIGGNTGGIRLQVIDHHTGYRVNTPEGAALRIRYLARQPQKIDELGAKARELVRENFLLTRQLREYLTLSVALVHGAQERIELG